MKRANTLGDIMLMKPRQHTSLLRGGGSGIVATPNQGVNHPSAVSHGRGVESTLKTPVCMPYSQTRTLTLLSTPRDIREIKRRGFCLHHLLFCLRAADFYVRAAFPLCGWHMETERGWNRDFNDFANANLGFLEVAGGFFFFFQFFVLFVDFFFF